MTTSSQIGFVLVTCVLGCALGGHRYHGYQEEEAHHKKPVVPILKSNFDKHHDSWHYSYETGNGIIAHEHGYFKNKGDKKHETLVQQGKVTYHDEHGHPITLTYVADEHGFQAHGDHLPTPPPIPEAILKALQQTHQIEEESQYQQDNKQEYQQEHQNPHLQSQEEAYAHYYQRQEK
ncbi:unnamed protein product [Brassicogethes aeneus]|uniref:Uncharacterized protein n=1 Tax=Brassicogethes aeneus TaxID=1431903 RepID=A0A9P0BB99_BRAAE|nr:unnamed protein product [Brassicogethes aeneus]